MAGSTSSTFLHATFSIASLGALVIGFTRYQQSKAVPALGVAAFGGVSFLFNELRFMKNAAD